MTLEDMARLALNKGYQPEIFASRGTGMPWLKIYHNWSEQRGWEIDGAFSDEELLDILNSFEPEHAYRVIDCEPKAFFGIAYQYDTREELIDFLKYILEEYGGWIGDDDDEFTIYTLENIDCLNLDYSPEFLASFEEELRQSQAAWKAKQALKDNSL
ncbi:hypothetical protein [Gloeobacter morelensis]|uniref:Uncharacterized protein n=1 Tax=Gloeobacter morelensis MG652769 TaxID=2781736 RepID=A0ABY3PKM2_9CYAN|nr:hypothetical protein [Gloeobacter morelensis]UFP94210.1 hypothetical protein ISF26_21010 [Gloeobacter morelensis MG652769]